MWQKILSDLLPHLIALDEKSRFSCNGSHVWANQGHSVAVEVSMRQVPANELSTVFHGTKAASLESIMETGLVFQSRQFVRLSKELATVTIVANRRKGKNVILKVNVEQMIQDGKQVFESENGIILTKEVLPEYITVI